MTGLTLAVLGPPDVRAGGVAVPLPAKSLALLVYLVMTGKRARRELLADMFWGDTGEDGARANLRLALSKLRQSLPGVLQADADSVGLAQGSLTDVDALQLLHTVDTLLQQPVTVQEAAISSYRGPFLQDFTLRDCAAFEDWVTAERQRIDRRAVVLLRELVQASRRAGKPERERHYLGLWARIEPWNEEVLLPLVRLLARAGATALALDRYEACRRALAEELGVRPSVALALLADQVRRGEVGPQTTPAPGYITAPAELAPASVATDATLALYGREADLHAMREQIAQGSRLITLFGPAGIGKSSLARVAALEQAQLYPDGLVACSFDALDAGMDEETSQGCVVDALGSALGLDLASTAHPLAMLKTHLATRRILLRLDGFETCIKAAPVLVELLLAAPWCLLLVTSRTRLTLAHGWTHEVRGLAAPQEGYGRDPGLDLLLDCARRAGVALDGARDHATLTRLVQQLDGSPLAIQFAAQSLRVMSPENLVDRLEQGAWPDASLHVPGYRYSCLEDVVADIWAQLDAGLQEGWVRCALFKGSFSLEWAHDCAGVGDRQIALLMERSIVAREPHGRLGMHGLIRLYGLQQLDTLAQAHTHRRVFAQAALGRLVSMSADLLREDAARVLDALRPDLATLGAAFDLALQWSSPQDIHPPLVALRRAYHRLGWYRAATRLIDSVLQRHEQAPAPWRVLWHGMAGEVIHNQYGHHRTSNHYFVAADLAGVVLPRPGARAWLSALASALSALAARPQASALACDAQRALTHSLLALLVSGYANGEPASRLVACLCAAVLAARRSGAAEARLAVLCRLVSLEKIGRFPRLHTTLVRRIHHDLKSAGPVHHAYASRAMAQAMIATGHWDAGNAHLLRAGPLLAALGHGYESQECLAQLNAIRLHRGEFRQLLDGVWTAEREARRTEQPTILRFALFFKLQTWLRTGIGTLDGADECMRAIHAIPVSRVRLEEMRLGANEALLLAAHGDAQGVLQRVDEFLRLTQGMSGGRFLTLMPMTVIIDATLHMAMLPRTASPNMQEALARLVARYLQLTGRVVIYAPRRYLYQGVVSSLQGQTAQAAWHWQQGLDCCAENDLRYDRARLHWMLALHGQEPGRAAHEHAAAEDFVHCGVTAAPYPLMPLRI